MYSGSHIYTWMHLKLLSNNGKNFRHYYRFIREIFSLEFPVIPCLDHTLHKFRVGISLSSLWSIQVLLCRSRVYLIALCVLERAWFVNIHSKTPSCAKSRIYRSLCILSMIPIFWATVRCQVQGKKDTWRTSGWTEGIRLFVHQIMNIDHVPDIRC